MVIMPNAETLILFIIVMSCSQACHVLLVEALKDYELLIERGGMLDGTIPAHCCNNDQLSHYILRINLLFINTLFIYKQIYLLISQLKINRTGVKLDRTYTHYYNSRH